MKKKGKEKQNKGTELGYQLLFNGSFYNRLVP